MTIRTLLMTAGLATVIGGALMAHIAHADEGTQTIVIENYAGIIEWETASRTSLNKEANSGDVRFTNGRLSSGADRNDLEDMCDYKGMRGEYDFDWFGKKSAGFFGNKALKDAPKVTLKIAPGTVLEIRDSVVYSLGTPDLHAAMIETEHCGKISLGDVETDLLFDTRGSTDLSFSSAGSLNADTRGSGDVEGGPVAGPVRFDTRGSGDLELESAGGLFFDSRGSGDAEIGTVNGLAELTTRGSGDVEIDRLDGDISFDSNGSGDVEIDELYANTARFYSRGSGDIMVDSGEITDLEIKVSGSSDAVIDADIENADAMASGSSDIVLSRVNGVLIENESGSGDVKMRG